MIKTAKIVALNSDIDAALSYISKEQSNLCFLAVVSSSLDDAFTRTRQALTEAEGAFFSPHGSVAGRLSAAREAIIKSLSDGENVQILLSAVFEDQTQTVLYLLGQGENLSAQLLRHDKTTNLTGQSLEEMISGLLEEGDRVVLSTQSLFDFLGEDSEILRAVPIESLEDEIAIRLPEAETLPVAALIIEKERVIKAAEEEQILPVENIKEQDTKIKFQLKFPPILQLLASSRRAMAVLGIMLLVAVAIGLFFSFQQKKQTETASNFEKNFKIAADQFNLAKEQKDTDPTAASKSLEEAKTALEEALKIKPNDSKILDLKKQIEESSTTILKIFSVADIPLWLDLGLIKKDFKAQNMSLSHGKILLLDPSTKSLVSITVSTKSNQMLPGKEKLGEAKFASLNGNIAWVFSQDQGILKIDTVENKITVAVKTDKEWGNIINIYGFANNVYLLDQGQVWKYVPVETGYSDKLKYLKSDKTDLADAKKLQIDSSVWVLKSGGQIIKYTQGSPDFFSISGLSKPIKEIKSFYVSDETDYIYLLDNWDKRLIVLDKKGVYGAEYQAGQMSSFIDLVVDEKGKKIYLLDGGKIYQINLQ